MRGVVDNRLRVRCIRYYSSSASSLCSAQQTPNLHRRREEPVSSTARMITLVRTVERSSHQPLLGRRRGAPTGVSNVIAFRLYAVRFR